MTYLVQHPAVVAARFGEHLVLTFASLAIALAIALPLGVLAARSPRAGGVTLAVLGVIYTIPSLALLAFLVRLMGLGTWTAIVALVAYAQMILVRNVAAGLRGVDPAQLDAATGLGFTPLQLLVRIEFPQALPVMVGGVRIATVSLIAVATVASFIHAGGLGDLLFDGIHQDDAQKIVAGSIASAALAIAADALLARAERLVRR
ncbi:MAG: ABC transporter permease [Candidatus Velthaea sp.]